MKTTTLLSEELQLKVSSKVRECFDIASRTYGKKFTMPHIRYNIWTTLGGEALFNVWLLRFNLILLIENEEEYINQIVPHEVAHLVTNKVFKIPKGRKRIQTHGKEWKEVMGIFNLHPATTHNFDCSSIQQRERLKKQKSAISKIDKIIMQIKKLDSEDKTILVDRIDNGAIFE